MDSFTFATGKIPLATGVIKLLSEYFQVDELLGFEPIEGNSAHYWLNIRKTGVNTSYLAECLVKDNKCKLRDVGYSGTKDRHAIITQWFSIPAA